MKKILAFVLTILLLLQTVPLVALAAETAAGPDPEGRTVTSDADAAVLMSGSAGDAVTWVLTDDGVITFSGSGPMKDYKDQDVFSTYYDPAPWWEYSSRITSVVIGEGITSIGSYAFTEHSSLRSVRLPAGFQSIGFKAFNHAFSLEEIALPNGAVSIDGYAFFFCSGLAHVTLPDTVTYIGEAAFSNCGLTELHIPSSLKTLYPGTFVNCGSLRAVTVPASVARIYSQVFNGCSSLTDIRFEHDYDDPLTFEHDDDRFPAFGGVTNLATRIGVPNRERINPALTEYDWGESGRSVTWYTVNAPEITSHPKDASVEENTSVTFSVTVRGTDLSYAWEYLEPDSDIWQSVGAGGTAASYTLKAAANQNGWKFRCTVSNAWGSAVSGEAVLTVIPVSTMPAFKSHSLVLSGQIGVNFFLYLPKIPGVDYAESYMEFTVGRNKTIQRADFDPSFTNSAGTRYGFTCYVTTAEAADAIVATFHYGNGLALSNEYSVDDYVGYFEEHADQYNQKTIDLIQILATYCLTCQRYLSSVNGWTLGIDHAQMTHAYGGIIWPEKIAEELESLKFVKQLGTSAVTKATYKLHLDSTITLDVLFTVPAGTALTASARFNGNTYTAEQQSDGRYLVRIPGFSAHQLGDMVTISGNAGGAFTVKACPMSYARSVLNNEDSPNAAIFCMGHMYRYYKAVLAYRA